jgi:protein involved in polysaccharide export with SLBB domain
LPRRLFAGVVSTLALAAVVGCEVDSYFDPSIVGRWENTPVTLPILERLDVIDEGSRYDLPVTGVQPEDLIPDTREYVIGPGDFLTVEVFELLQAGGTELQQRRVDEQGNIRLQVVGEVNAAGRSPSQLESHIADVLQQRGVLQDATVSVQLVQSRQNTYSVVGAPDRVNGTQFGTYVIPKPDFRLLEALALAGGIPGRTQNVLIIRQTPLQEEVMGDMGPAGQPGEGEQPPAPQDNADLIQEVEGALEGGPSEPRIDEDQPEDRPAAPRAIEGGLGGEGDTRQWIYIDGEWVAAGSAAGGDGRQPAGSSDQIDEEQETLNELGQYITQRIVRVPYNRLVQGDMRYNVVVRAGDIIRIPDPTAGFVYIMGQISRPGAYTVPGERDLTLKQLIASAGNLNGLAIPERVDLVRRVGDNQEAVVRLNLRAIFNGTEPDIFLKPNDLVNIGTSFAATPLAVFRNGLRSTYGFGFVIDRNFDDDVFGAQ